jgi:hypothetical protein
METFPWKRIHVGGVVFYKVRVYQKKVHEQFFPEFIRYVLAMKYIIYESDKLV